jgi:hypothetical protein
MKLIAKITSWVFLPLLAPVYALAIALYTEVLEKDITKSFALYILNDEAKHALLYLFFALSFIGPAIVLLLLLMRGSIKSLLLDDRNERIYPSIMVNLFAVFLIIILLKIVPAEFRGLPLLLALSVGSFVTVLTCTLLTIKWKVSLHAAGMGILTGFVFAYFLSMSYFPVWMVPLSFLLSGFVMSMRMYLEAHNLSQSLVGYGIGFFATFSAVFIIS